MISKISDENPIEEILVTIVNNTKKPEKFLSAQPDVASKFRKELKNIYDFTHNELQRKSNALPELVIDGFDEEQIWQQLEIKNDSEITHLLGAVSRVLVGNKSLELPVSVTEPQQENSQSDEDDLEDENIASDGPEDEDDDDEEINNEDEDSEMNFSGSDDEMDLDREGNMQKKEKKQSNKHCKTSIVDDEFFKLDELDDFLNKEDKKEMDGDKSDSESIDMFKDDESGEEDEARMMKFSDFFDRPRNSNNEKPPRNDEKSFQQDMDDEPEEKNDKKRKLNEPDASKKRVKFNLLNDYADDNVAEENNDNDDDDDDDDDGNVKSTLESRQERLKKKIEKLEKEAISEKPWQLKGEVSASNRPENSLLEEFVEVDIATRPAPVYTEQTSAKLEDIIIQRIKDKAWDSVERKYKSVETEPEYKKKLVMDQEKSTKGLAQVYEEDYLQQKQAKLNPDAQEEREEEEPKAHQEIRQLTHSLFAKLDALSNFHFTPKPAKPEIKIVSNIPAITMEEVAPLATTDATLLAPEEITRKPRGDVIGKSERTKTDMNRARRKKKIYQKEKAKAAEKKEQAMKDKPIKNKKQAKILEDAMVKKLTKSKNVTKIDESNRKLPKSSTAFFTQLQDQVSKK